MSAQPLRESEIRPDHLMAEQKARGNRDAARLLSREAEFVEVNCPACAEISHEDVFRKYGLQYVRCTACRTMYVTPRPPSPVLENFYATSENYEYWSTHIFPASESVRRERIFRPRAQRVAEICRKHASRTDVLLEVGAGYGTFCEEVRSLKLFTRIIAVEPTPSLANVCRERGLEVIGKPVESVELAGLSVDVVASFEVIEHLFSPADFVRSCAALLRPGGLLVLTCPNVLGFDLQVLGKASNTFDFEHLNYFHPRSLAALVERHGFETLEVITPGKLDAELARKGALSGEISLADQPFLEQVLIDEWERIGPVFQDFLANNGLSSHMWLVARKTSK
jgi:2-polyprenyl-3-methyl-5-hydroxy-6-metoxy-1,4-benzoquinol methylase/ribosomal protein S27E